MNPVWHGYISAPMAITTHSARARGISGWIIACMGMVLLMVLVGGITRLTESGLSIVEWKLLSGIFPPLTHEGWEQELAAYRQTPEYQQINRGMSVSEFKQIFWLEYIHRILGRLTGLVFLVPFAYFALRKRMDAALTGRMALACLLVCAQGGVGWVMVASGLVDDPRVSPVKLAMHLSLAFTVWCVLLWTLLQLRGASRYPAMAGGALIRLIMALLAIQIIMGALVAGLDAGLVYNSFPLMDGDWIPQGLWMLEPASRNFIDNVMLVQFQHRWMAVAVSVAILLFVACAWKTAPQPLRRLLTFTAVTLMIQFILGVLTLIHAVPIGLASAHQLVALLLLSLILILCYAYPSKRATQATVNPKNPQPSTLFP